jgi:hypothetical protein
MRKYTASGGVMSSDPDKVKALDVALDMARTLAVRPDFSVPYSIDDVLADARKVQAYLEESEE